MRELERERQRDKSYLAETEGIREELGEGDAGEDEKSLRRSTRKAKTKSGRRKKHLILLLCAVLLSAGLFLLFYSPYSEGLLDKENSLFGMLTGSERPEEAEQAPSDEEPGGEEEPVVEGQDEEQDAAGSPEPAEEEAEENVYAATMTSEVKDSLAGLPEKVYIPNVVDGTIHVVDPKTFEIIDYYTVEQLPFHVTPSWDMSQLLVNNEESSTFTVIDPETGRPSGTIAAPFPYNFYFTPDGETAIVVVERLQMLEFRDTETWELKGSTYIPWPGVDHLDFSADGSYLLASSEWSGAVSKVDVEKMELMDYADVGGLPIDIKVSPDGEVFYVANQGTMGVSVIDPDEMEEIDFIPTGQGAHGLQISRDTKSLYVSNRLEGTVSVIDMGTNKVTDTWFTGGSPDMFQISPDGKQLWVSGRYDGAVYVLDTESGKLLSTIYTGVQPHGLVYFPNPGRFSLGHNGVYR